MKVQIQTTDSETGTQHSFATTMTEISAAELVRVFNEDEGKQIEEPVTTKREVVALTRMGHVCAFILQETEVIYFGKLLVVGHIYIQD